jgi:hypothetical protein
VVKSDFIVSISPATLDVFVKRSTGPQHDHGASHDLSAVEEVVGDLPQRTHGISNVDLLLSLVVQGIARHVGHAYGHLTQAVAESEVILVHTCDCPVTAPHA